MAFRVADFTRVLAGPWATQTLGDQGFDIVKVEALTGDETRGFHPIVRGESVYFACTNRNKRSIALDLRTEPGQRVARRLIESADVIIENFRPGVMERFGLGATMRGSRQVWVSISAFGDDNNGAGYDLVLQSVGGITTLTGDPPAKAGPSIADLATAQVAVQAVLFGLLAREQTGLGRYFDLSMLDVQHALLAYYASASLNAGSAPPTPSNAHPSIAPYNLYRCADGWLAICCANDGLWHRLREALDLPDEARWGSLSERVADRARLDAAITARLGAGAVTTWEARLSAAGVPCGPALSVAASLAHPAAKQIEVGGWRLPAPPLALQSMRPPPRLGEHTDEVLAELGFGVDDVADLRRLGAVGPELVPR